MVFVALILLGLCFGSFVNAFVWRLRQQELPKNKKQETKNKYSVLQGRSMCPNCKHELAPKDLVPVLSWLWLRGKCRYCHKPISVQYPLVEATTAALFAVSYVFWPVGVTSWQVVVFGLWLVLLVGLMSLQVYDLRWMLLPNKIVFPLMSVAAVQAIVRIAVDPKPLRALFQEFLAIVLGGGIFYVLFQVSGGRWIGGGDVKLGWLLGIILGTAEKSLFMIFLAALLGSLTALPMLANKRLKRTSKIPFGPFLIVAAIVIVLFGDSIVYWYNHTVLLMD